MNDEGRVIQRKVVEDLANKVAQNDPVLGAQLWAIVMSASG